MAFYETIWYGGSFYFNAVCGLFAFAALFIETIAICKPIARTLLSANPG